MISCVGRRGFRRAKAAGGRAPPAPRLMAQGANPNATHRGESALELALGSGQVDCAIKLLEGGADPRIKQSSGQPMAFGLVDAASLGAGVRPVIAAFIQAGGDLNELSGAGGSAIARAAMHGLWGAFDALREAGADPAWGFEDGRTPLMAAAWRGEVDLVECREGMGAVDALDSRGQRALHVAAERGHMKTVRKLLDMGAHPDAPDKEGVSPLALAASSGSLAAAMELLRAGADPNQADALGRSPLHRAAARGRLAEARALLAAGADASAVDHEGKTPARRAQAGEKHELAELLRQWALPREEARALDETVAQGRERARPRL